MKYNAQFFLDLFQAIPPEKWNDWIQHDVYTDTHCVYGHLRVEAHSNGAYTEQGKVLTAIMGQLPNLKHVHEHENWCESGSAYNFTPARINNGQVVNYKQPTPKARIIAALQDCIKIGL